MHLNFAVDLDQAQARGLTNKDVEDVKRLMKQDETLWASDHRALVVNFRCA